MKNTNLVQSLIKHVLNEEVNDTQDLSAVPDEQQTQNPPKSAKTPESVLISASQNKEFKKLIVFRPQTGLWEVSVTPDGRVVATQLRLTKTDNTIEPTTPEDIAQFEKNFGLDRGINTTHVTVIK
jgi:hypothetical protein